MTDSVETQPAELTDIVEVVSVGPEPEQRALALQLGQPGPDRIRRQAVRCFLGQSPRRCEVAAQHLVDPHQWSGQGLRPARHRL